MMFIYIPAGEAHAEWLFYDEGSTGYPSSLFVYQGVRFTLPEETVKAPLYKISFYYSCPGSCPVTIHVTGHDRSSRVIDPMDYTAVNGWNEVDVSGSAVLVPHTFYVILEKHETGSPVLDDGITAGRSFKGHFLTSMNIPLSRNLILRTEIGPAVLVPVLKQLEAVITETTKVNIQGNPRETYVRTFSEKWTLFSDGTFMTENYLYGNWRQKGRKLLFFYDTEDIVNLLKDDLPYETMGMSIAKMSFSGTEKKNLTIKGSYKMYVGSYFPEYDGVGKILIKGKFIAAPDE